MKVQIKSREIDNMATREDNLKKINNELEAMSDEELEQVAGGTHNMTASDTRALNEMGFDIEPLSAVQTAWAPNYHKAKAAVNRVFSKYGISVDAGFSGDNAYYQGDKVITRKKAFEIICQRTGKSFPEAFDY